MEDFRSVHRDRNENDNIIHVVRIISGADEPHVPFVTMIGNKGLESVCILDTEYSGGTRHKTNGEQHRKCQNENNVEQICETFDD